MIARRGVGILIGALGIGFFGWALVRGSPTPVGTPRLTAALPTIKQGHPAVHPVLQWVEMTSRQHGWSLNRGDRLLVTWNEGHTWYRTPAVDVANGPSNAWNATHVQGFYALNARDAWVSTWVRNGLYRTTNGGRTWVKLQAPGAGWLDFLTPKRGWMLTEGGVAMGTYPSDLYDTIDGGAHWHLVASTFSTRPKTSRPTLPPNLKTGVTFQSPTQGWIASVNSYYYGSQPSPVLSRTTNRGHSWTWAILPREPGTGSPIGNPPEFFPVTGRHGLIPLVSSPFTPSTHLAQTRHIVWYQTNDRGIHWERVGQIMQPTARHSRGLDISFISASHGWILWSQGRHLWHTRNGGRTWTTWTIQTPEHPGVHVAGIDFLTAFYGWAVSIHGHLWSTADGGRIWTPIAAGNS